MFLIDKEVAEILIQLYILHQKKTMCQPSSRRQRKRRISCTQGIRVITAKQSVFFSKSVKKSVKRGESCAREARRACEARGKKPTVRFSYNDFVPTRGFKNVVELSKNCSQLHPLCEFDTLGDWFRGRICRENVVYKVTCKVEDQKWVEVAVSQQSLYLLLVFFTSLPCLALCSTPFVWLLASSWILKNTDCFAV